MMLKEEKTQPYKMYAPGTVVSHYKIVKRIGYGGIGEVYLASDNELDRDIALKFISTNLSDDYELKSQFRREALVSARLNHPNIATTYEVGEFHDRPFIATEFVSGSSFRALLKSKDLSLFEVMTIAIQICDGLVSAHSMGIVHGDLKPSNILIRHDGHLKLIDFGLGNSILKKDSAGSQLVFGTMGYMSPEQIRGEDVDQRTDLFSLGVVLYEALVRKHPFEQRSESEIMHSMLESDPPPLSRYRSGIPADLIDLVNKLLKKDMRQRFQDATAVRSILLPLYRSFQTNTNGSRAFAGLPERSIAVIPFSSPDEVFDEKYLTEGIADELIMAMSKISGIRVAARNESFALSSRMNNLHTLGNRLNVETILKGDVEKRGEKLHLVVQLIDVSNGKCLWLEEFDCMRSELYGIYGKIINAISRVLQLKADVGECKIAADKPTENSKAYDFYLRGLQFYHKRQKQSFVFGSQMFSKAVQIDPAFAQAYAFLADCNSLLTHFYGDPTGAHLREADSASKKALELAPSLSIAHSARGFALWLMKDFDACIKEFEIAINLDPRQFDAYYLYGRASFQQGDFTKAASLFESACEIRDDHEAEFFTAQAFTALGRHAEANTAYMRAMQSIGNHVELNPDNARAVTFGAVTKCRLGEVAAGLDWAERALMIDPNDPGISYNVACLFALEGKYERAIDCLEEAVRGGFAHYDWVKNDPDLDSIRDIPRFKELNWRE